MDLQEVRNVLALMEEPKVERKNINLTQEERTLFFYWCRDQALDAMQIGIQMKKLNVPRQHILDETMNYLETARNVFPLTENGESVSILDILNGKEPKP